MPKKENMYLPVQNMEPDIISNGSKKISKYIMCDHVFSLMSIKKQVYSYRIYGLAAYASRKTMSCRMGEAQFGV